MRTPVALELAAKNLLNRLLHLNTAQRNPSSEPYEIAIASSTAQREQSNGPRNHRRVPERAKRARVGVLVHFDCWAARSSCCFASDQSEVR